MPPNLKFINNTGDDIVIVVEEKEYLISHHGMTTIKHYLPTIWIIFGSDEAQRYRLTGPPRKYFSDNLIVTLQIEPDHHIYVLERGTKNRVQKLPEQPPGFPLAPSLRFEQ